MSAKYFFLLFSTLLLAQCVLANSSEENGGGSSEKKLYEEHVTRHVTKLYNKLVGEIITATRRNFETIINDVQTTKIQTSPKVHEKLNELQTVLERATKTTTNTNVNEEKRNKRRILKELGKVAKEMREIEQETNNPTDGDKAVRNAHDNVRNEIDEQIRTFLDRAIRDVDRYLNTLSATEQKKKHNLRDTLTEVRNGATTQRKTELLDHIFIFNENTE